MSVIDWLKRIKLFNVAYIKFLKCHDDFMKILSLNALTAFDSVFFQISHLFFWILKRIITSRVTCLSSLKTSFTKSLSLESVAILLSLWVSVCSTALRFDDNDVLKLLMWQHFFYNVTQYLDKLIIIKINVFSCCIWDENHLMWLDNVWSSRKFMQQTIEKKNKRECQIVSWWIDI